VGHTFMKGLEISQVTGNHFTMMDQDAHSLTLAQELRKLLERDCSIAPSMHERLDIPKISARERMRARKGAKSLARRITRF